MATEPPPGSDLPSSLTKTLVSSDLSHLAAVGEDLTEVALDAFMKEGVYRDLPVVSTVVNLWKAGASFRDASFLRKLRTFLVSLEKTTAEQRRKMIESLENSTAQ